MSAELLQALVQTTQAVFGARAVSVARHDPDSGDLIFEAVAGEGADVLPGQRIPADAGIAGWVFRSGQPIVIEDVASDPRFAAGFARTTGYVPQGIMAAPLEGDEGPVGVLTVLDRPRRPEFSLVELDLLGRFCHLVTLALDATVPDHHGPVAELAGALDELPPGRRAAAERVVDALSAYFAP